MNPEKRSAIAAWFMLIGDTMQKGWRQAAKAMTDDDVEAAAELLQMMAMHGQKIANDVTTAAKRERLEDVLSEIPTGDWQGEPK